MAKVGEPVSANLVWDWRVAVGILVKSVYFAESGNGYFGASCAAAGGGFLKMNIYLLGEVSGCLSTS